MQVISTKLLGGGIHREIDTHILNPGVSGAGIAIYTTTEPWIADSHQGPKSFAQRGNLMTPTSAVWWEGGNALNGFRGQLVCVYQVADGAVARFAVEQFFEK